MKVIQEDSRQQKNKKHHKIKREYFESVGYKVIRSKLLVGDYCIPGNGSVVVDTKMDCGELYTDLVQDHERFHNECVLAQECGIKLYILVENEFGYKKKEDIIAWNNPLWRSWYMRKRNHEIVGDLTIMVPKCPCSNEDLIKKMETMEERYGVEFMFCSTEEAGAIIVNLLE